jgi:hypothetical protein
MQRSQTCRLVSLCTAKPKLETWPRSWAQGLWGAVNKRELRILHRAWRKKYVMTILLQSFLSNYISLLFQVSFLLLGVTYSSAAKKTSCDVNRLRNDFVSVVLCSVCALNCLEIGNGSKLHVVTLAGNLMSTFGVSGNCLVEMLVKSSDKGEEWCLLGCYAVWLL